jgi:hypothetical protein
MMFGLTLQFAAEALARRAVKANKSCRLVVGEVGEGVWEM